jgi:hypothetical protein
VVVVLVFQAEGFAEGLLRLRSPLQAAQRHAQRVPVRGHARIQVRRRLQVAHGFGRLAHVAQQLSELETEAGVARRQGQRLRNPPRLGSRRCSRNTWPSRM